MNVFAVIVGSFLGLGLPKVPDRFHDTVMQGIALTVILIGLSMALNDSADILIIIISMAIGGLLGSWINIERRLDQLGERLQRHSGSSDGGRIAEGFVTASLIFCVGSLSIVGAIQSGISGDNHTLFAKSELDLVTSTVLASTFGMGVLFAVFPVAIYEGGIALLAHFLGKQLQDPAVFACMNAAGGLLIAGIGINILGIKKLAVANLLPAMFVAAALKWAAPYITSWLPYFHS